MFINRRAHKDDVVIQLYNGILKGKSLLLSHFQLFCNPMDCSPPGFSVRGISQARIQEWFTVSFSRGFSQPGIKSTSPPLLLSHPGSPMEYYSAIKNNKIMPLAATWMGLEIVILSEVSQRKANIV